MQRISLKIGQENIMLQCSAGKSIITGVKIENVKFANGWSNRKNENKNDNKKRFLSKIWKTGSTIKYSSQGTSLPNGSFFLH